MVKLLIPMILFIGSLKAQVAIGGDELSSNEVFRVTSNNKGVLLPNVSLTTLHSKISDEMVDYLMVYNTNDDIGKGFFYWKNNQWNPIITPDNMFMNSQRLQTKGSVSYDFIELNNVENVTTFRKDENFSEKNWKAIPGLDLNFKIINKKKNNVTFSIDGATVLKSTASQEANAEYAVGLFLNDKLYTVRNFNVKKDTSECNISNFSFSPTASNLPIGDYTAKVGVIVLNATNNFQSLLIGGMTNQCIGKLTDFMLRSNLVIRIAQ